MSENVGIEPKRGPKKKAKGCQTGTKQSQMGARMKKARPKTTFAEQEMFLFGNGMRKGSQCMLKGCHNEDKNDAKKHEQLHDKSGNEKLMKFMINADETMPKWNQKS